MWHLNFRIFCNNTSPDISISNKKYSFVAPDNVDFWAMDLGVCKRFGKLSPAYRYANIHVYLCDIRRITHHTMIIPSEWFEGKTGGIP